jgi:RNA-directed DNA polymerase
MTSSALHRIFQVSAIRGAWEDFWGDIKRQRSSGVDDVTPNDFQRSLEANLQTIYRDVRAGYRFADLCGVPVPKKDPSQYRVICIPTVRDRLTQRILSRYLTDQAERLRILNDVSFGFLPSSDGKRRGVSAARDRALILRTRSQWAYKSDISAFFDQIPRGEVVAKTVSALRAPSIRSILAAAVACELDQSDPAINRIASENKIIRGRGVRQGMPLSPIFANVILNDFDKEMIRREMKMVRYADDFVVFAESRDECLHIDSLVRKLLAPLGLTVPDIGAENSKTVIARPEEDIEFLGLVLSAEPNGGYHLSISDPQLEKVKRELNKLKDVDLLVRERINITKVTNRIENKIAGYLSAYHDASNTNDLRVILDESRSQILRSIFVRAFGELAVQKLSRNMCKFLCLT